MPTKQFLLPAPLLGLAILLVTVFVTIGVLEVMRRLDDAAVKTTRHRMSNVSTALSLYRQHSGQFPDHLHELMVASPKTYCAYLIEDPGRLTDGWGRLLGYRRLDSGGYELTSFGADGEPGGTGHDEDLVEDFEP